MNRCSAIAIVLASSLVGALCLAQQPSSEGEIRVNSHPEGATVYLNRSNIGVTPVSLSGLRPGMHMVSLAMHGYEQARRTVSLEPGQRRSVDVTLEPLRGLLLVHSSPQGAEVMVDGAFKGKTPALIAELTLGDYRMKLSYPGYVSRELDVRIRDRIPRKIEVSLISDSSTLQITSTPPGADVIVNGVSHGPTPTTIDRLPAGDCTVDLRMDGHEPHSVSLRLQGGVTEWISAVLSPLPSSLKIVSIPDGARVYVNDQFRGESPAEINNLQPATYRVRLELEGHDIMARNVALSPGGSAVEEFRLARNAGTIRITTVPPEVQVLLDGRPVGETPRGVGTIQTISEPLEIPLVSMGRHELQLTKKGYYDISKTITVERDSTLILHEVLRRRFVPNYEVATGTQVHRGVLIEIAPTGDIRMEIRPGIERTFPADEIRAHQSITPD